MGPAYMYGGEGLVPGLKWEGVEGVREWVLVSEDPDAPLPMKALGHVTSSYPSSVIGRSIAIGMVAGGRARIGETLHVPMPSGAIAVEVVEPIFFDREGERIHG